MLTQDRVRELFDYREDGYLIRRVSRGRPDLVGKVAGGLSRARNYAQWCLRIDGRTYKASRIIWLWHFGELPALLDHKDRNSLNDRIDNLRIATCSQNGSNTSLSKFNTSGFRGVSPSRKLWRACLTISNKRKHLGYFDDPIEAAKAYNAAAKKMFGEFAVLNEIPQVPTQDAD